MYPLFLPCSQFCAQAVKSRGDFCLQHSGGGAGGGGGTASSLRVIEGNRRRMVVDVRLENKGENAYNARLNITYTPNLRFSSLVVKVPHRLRVDWPTARPAVPSTDFFFLHLCARTPLISEWIVLRRTGRGRRRSVTSALLS